MSDEIKAFLFYQAAAFVIALLFGRRSQLDAWAESKPYLAAVLKFLRATGVDPWMVLQSTSLLVHEKLPKGMGAPKPPPPANELVLDDDTVTVPPPVIVPPKPPEPPSAA